MFLQNSVVTRFFALIRERSGINFVTGHSSAHLIHLYNDVLTRLLHTSLRLEVDRTMAQTEICIFSPLTLQNTLTIMTRYCELDSNANQSQCQPTLNGSDSNLTINCGPAVLAVIRSYYFILIVLQVYGRRYFPNH